MFQAMQRAAKTTRESERERRREGERAPNNHFYIMRMKKCSVHDMCGSVFKRLPIIFDNTIHEAIYIYFCSFLVR